MSEAVKTREIHYDFTGVPTLEEFVSDRHKVKLAMGPFGSGKSSACCWNIFLTHIEQTPMVDGVVRTRWAIVRNTYGELIDTTLKTVLNWFPPDAFPGSKLVMKPRPEYTLRFNHVQSDGVTRKMEIQMMFRALDDDDQIKDLLSLELTGIWFNEAREITQGIFKAGFGRTGRFPAKVFDKDDQTKQIQGPTWSGVIMDTNPFHTRHWMFDYFEKKRPALAKMWRQPPALLTDIDEQSGEYILIGKNPDAENTKYLEDDYYENMFANANGDKEFIKVNVLGEYGFSMSGLPVYPGYKDSTHFREKLPYIPDIPVGRGWDYGRTPAVSFFQVTPRGQVRVLGEVVCEDTDVSEASKAAIRYGAKHFPGAIYYDWGDPAGKTKSGEESKSCIDVQRSHGIICAPASTQDQKIRKSAIKGPLKAMVDGEPGFLVGPNAPTIREALMGGYHYRTVKQNDDANEPDKPVKNMYSHVIEALEYGLMDSFGTMIRTSTFDDGPAFNEDLEPDEDGLFF